MNESVAVIDNFFHDVIITTNNKYPNKHEIDGRLPVSYCSKADKVIYDKKSANTAKNRRFQQDHVALRVYECEVCHGWHLTKAGKK